MTPWLQAYNSALKFGITPEEWSERISECLQRGYVFSSPTEFVAALDTEHQGEMAYLVYIAAGGSGHVLGRFLRYAPRPKPWVIWHRRNEARPRVFAWDKLMKKIGGQ
jgi:hypothetical protein